MLLLDSKMVSVSWISLIVMSLFVIGAAPADVYTSMDIGDFQTKCRNIFNVAGKTAYDEATKKRDILTSDFASCKTKISVEKTACDNCANANCTLASNEQTKLQQALGTATSILTSFTKITDLKAWSGLANYFNTEVNLPIKDIGDNFVPWTMNAKDAAGNWLVGVGNDIKDFVLNLPQTVLTGLENIWKNTGGKIIGFLGRRRKRSVAAVKTERERIMNEELNKKDAHTQDCYKTKCPGCKSFVSPKSEIIMGAVCGDDLLITNSSLFTYFNTLRTLKADNDAGYVLKKIEVVQSYVVPENFDPLIGAFKKVRATFQQDGQNTTYQSSVPYTFLQTATFGEKMCMEIWSKLGL